MWYFTCVIIGGVIKTQQAIDQDNFVHVTTFRRNKLPAISYWFTTKYYPKSTEKRKNKKRKVIKENHQWIHLYWPVWLLNYYFTFHEMRIKRHEKKNVNIISKCNDEKKNQSITCYFRFSALTNLQVIRLCSFLSIYF